MNRKFIIGLALPVLLAIMGMMLIFSGLSNGPELSCRDGKLYEVTHEQNLTIYDPTYNDCEEVK